MANKKDQKPLEFEAKWAPSDEWPPRVPKKKSPVAARVEQFLKKMDPDHGKKEVKRLPYRERLKHLPHAFVRSVPLSFSLLALYLATLIMASYAAIGDMGLVAIRLTPILPLVWMVTVTLFIGFQIAAYAPGVCQPSFKELWKGVRRNWPYFLFVVAVLGFSDIFGEDDSETVVIDLATTLFLAGILFGVADMKVFEKAEDEDAPAN